MDDRPIRQHEQWNRTVAFIGAVFVGLISTSVVVAIIWGIAASYTKDEIQAQRQSTHYAESASEQIQERCQSPDLATQRHCIEEIITSTHENQRDEADLQAQWQMAYWAYVMVVISGFSFIATIAGIYFVRENLIEMQRARKVSEDAVVAAQESNKVSREIGEAQVRAYLTCTVAQISVNMDGVVFSPIVKNSGQTPADDIRITAIIQHSNRVGDDAVKS